MRSYPRANMKSCNLRPLLARETLEDDLGVAVDAQVLDCVGVAEGRGAVASLG